jgi:hypothetical protein
MNNIAKKNYDPTNRDSLDFFDDFEDPPIPSQKKSQLPPIQHKSRASIDFNDEFDLDNVLGGIGGGGNKKLLNSIKRTNDTLDDPWSQSPGQNNSASTRSKKVSEWGNED